MLVRIFAFLSALFVCVPAVAVTKFDQSAIKQYIKNGANNIKFVEVCDNGGGKCDKDMFEDANVQMYEAMALAEEYILIKHQQNAVCSPAFRKSYNDDYVKCTDKSGKSFYEFRFDDVKESFDKTRQKSIGRALCQIHGGKMPNDDNLCYINSCSLLNKSLAKFNFSSTFLNNMGSTPGCKIDYGTKHTDSYQLKTAFGIDPEKFKHLQIQSGADLEFLLKRYTGRQMKANGKTLTSFSCKKSFNTYKTGELTNLKDDILSCTANNVELEFLFDDTGESIDFTANIGTAGLSCIADSGGTYDGKNCYGLDKKQCSALGARVKGGTRWDTTLDTCILNNAATAETVKTDANIALSVVVGIATVATGGGALVVVFAVAGAAGAATTKVAQAGKEAEVRKFLAQSQKCKQSMCAEQTLKIYIDNAARYHNDISGQLLSAVDDELARLLNLLPDNSKLLIESIADAQKGAKLANFDNWTAVEKLDFAGKVLLGIGATAGVAHAAKTGWPRVVSGIKSLKTGAASASKAIKTVISKTEKLKNYISKISDVGGVIDDSLDVGSIVESLVDMSSI